MQRLAQMKEEGWNGHVYLTSLWELLSATLALPELTVEALWASQLELLGCWAEVTVLQLVILILTILEGSKKKLIFFYI